MDDRSPWDEGGGPYVYIDLPYARLPHEALSLSDGAYKLLGFILKDAQHHSYSEIMDSEIATHFRKTRDSVQRALRELEEAQFISRVRRCGRRRIILLFTVAGRESKRAQKPKGSDVHAIRNNQAREPDGFYMQSESIGLPPDPPNKEETKEQQQQAGCAGEDVVVAPVSEFEEDREPPGRAAFLAGMVSDLAMILTAEPEQRSRAKTPAAGESLARDPAAGEGTPSLDNTIIR